MAALGLPVGACALHGVHTGDTQRERGTHHVLVPSAGTSPAPGSGDAAAGVYSRMWPCPPGCAASPVFTCHLCLPGAERQRGRCPAAPGTRCHQGHCHYSTPSSRPRAPHGTARDPPKAPPPSWGHLGEGKTTRKTRRKDCGVAGDSGEARWPCPAPPEERDPTGPASAGRSAGRPRSNRERFVPPGPRNSGAFVRPGEADTAAPSREQPRSLLGAGGCPGGVAGWWHRGGGSTPGSGVTVSRARQGHGRRCQGQGCVWLQPRG